MARRIAFLLTLAALCAPASAAAQTAPFGGTPGNPLSPQLPAAGVPAFAPGEVIVGFERGADAETRTDARAAVGADVQDKLSLPGVQVLDLPVGETVLGAARELEAQPGVAFAEPNWRYEPQATTPNDPRYPGLWGMTRIGMPKAWDYTRGSSSTTIAVIDTGFDYNHSDLAFNESSPRGYDFVDNDSDPRDEQGHGSHVAGTIGARGNDGYGVAGVNWNSKLMNLKVCRVLCDNDAIADAINYAGANGAKVANISISGPARSDAIQAALNNNPNLLVVTAAGNTSTNNDSSPRYPCNYTNANVICVAATDSSDGRASFSNVGRTSVDIAAPGTAIDSTYPFTEVVQDGFENGDFASNWTQGGFHSRWSVSSDTGSQMLTDSPGAACLSGTLTHCYSKGASNWVQHNVRNTNGLNTCWVDFRAASALREGDYAYAESSSGSGVWTETRWFTSDNAFDYYHDRLPSSFDNRGEYWLRFRLQDNGDNNVADGFYVDDVNVVCRQHSNPWKSIQGTSMAAPHVAGVAGLIYSMKPSASVAEVRDAILQTADPVASMSGITTTGGRLNAFAALARFDKTPPDTTIETKPDAVTKSTAGGFTFRSNEPNVTFECVLDGSDAAFQPCTSGKTYSGLGHGSHTFRVRAKDAGGNYDPAPASYTWVVDLEPPDTSITSAPSALTNEPVGRFVFRGTETGSTFECKLGSGGWQPCSSPYDTPALGEGSHAFQVRAIDGVGHVDPTPDGAAWTVDLTAPTTTVTVAPEAVVTTSQVRFEFTADEVANFECEIDGHGWGACGSPLEIAGLAGGTHTFGVRAVDAVGNREAVPVVHAFEVRLPAERPQEPQQPQQPEAPQQPQQPETPAHSEAKPSSSPKALVKAVGDALADLTPRAVAKLDPFALAYSARTPGKLTLDIYIVGRKDKLTRIGGATLTFAGRGRGEVKIALTRSGKRLLARQKKATLSLRATWTPKRGRKAMASRAVTLG